MEFANINEIEIESLTEAKEHMAAFHSEKIETALYRTDFKVENNVPFLRANGDYHPMTNYAFAGLCKELETPVPVTFAERVPNKMLNYIVQELKNTNKEVCIFTKKEPSCILYVRPYPFKPLKNIDIVDVCEEAIQRKSLAKCYLSDISLEIEVREKEGEEILPGDPHHHVMRVFNSEVGIKGAYVQTGLLRSICWNSALISECVRWNYDYRRGYQYNFQNFRGKVLQMKYDDTVFTKLRSSVIKRLTDEEIVRIWRTLARALSMLHADKIVGMDVESRKQIVARVTERHRKRSVHYGEPGVETEFKAYELGNRITAYAREVRNFLQRNHLENLGGDVLLLN